MIARCPWFLKLFLVGALTAGSASAQSAPRLTQGPAYLGGVLELRLDSAVPGAHFDLWFSREPGHWLLPYGWLELKRDRLRRVASGVVDGSGAALVLLPLSSQPAAAEGELRFQAIVDDPGAAAGRRLTNAVVSRLAGPRLYAGFHGSANSGLFVISGLQAGIVTRVDFGFATPGGEVREEGHPVFDRDLSVGAVLAGQRSLVFFDPHFGTVLGSVDLAVDAARNLCTDAARRTVYLLETGLGGSSSQPGRVLRFDLATRSLNGVLDLPGPATGLWSANRDGQYACIAEAAPSGATVVRFVDLVNLADLGTASVGQPTNRRFEDLTWGWGEVWVSTSDPLGIGAAQGTLSRIPRPDLPGVPDVGPAGVPRLLHLIPVAAVRRVLVPQFFHNVPATTLASHDLEGVLPPVPVPGPPAFLSVAGASVDGSRVWILDRAGDEPPGGSEPGRVHVLDLATLSWSSVPRTWPFAGPADAERLRDAFVDLLAVANVPLPPPISIAPEVLLITQSDGSEQHVLVPEAVTFLAPAPVP